METRTRTPAQTRPAIGLSARRTSIVDVPKVVEFIDRIAGMSNDNQLSRVSESEVLGIVSGGRSFSVFDGDDLVAHMCSVRISDGMIELRAGAVAPGYNGGVGIAGSNMHLSNVLRFLVLDAILSDASIPDSTALLSTKLSEGAGGKGFSMLFATGFRAVPFETLPDDVKRGTPPETIVFLTTTVGAVRRLFKDKHIRGAADYEELVSEWMEESRAHGAIKPQAVSLRGGAGQHA